MFAQKISKDKGKRFS